MKSDDRQIDVRLIKQAQSGQQESLARLTELVQDHVYVFLYRMTLNHHLAQDLRQETLLQLMKSLPSVKFENKDMFWAWIYKIAVSKVKRHFRVQGNKRIEHGTIINSEWLKDQPDREEPGLSRLIRQELGQVIAKAMNQLTPRYRGILALRCFNDMSYTQIAAIMGGSKLQARVSFFRARQALKRQFQRDGLEKADLLPALGLFAALTSSGTTKAAASGAVSSSSLQVGFNATVLGTLTTKVGMAACATVVAGVLTLGTVTLVQHPASSASNASTAYQKTIDHVPPDLETRIDTIISQEIKNYNFIHLAMIQDANILSIRSYGPMADINFPCRYASVSKTVTSVLVLQMLEQGRIRSLDDNIWDYLPALRHSLPAPYAQNNLTIRHLLSHTSGLPNTRQPQWQQNKLILLFEPGQQFEYSWAGYALLQQILEHITGQSYAQLVNEYIARPIQATSFFVESPNSAAGGVSSTIEDLGLFVQAILQETYLTADTLYHQLWSPVESHIPFGLGWDLHNVQTDNLTVSDDSAYGSHRVLIIMKPHRKTGIAILADAKVSAKQDPDLHIQLGHRLLDLLDP